MEKKRKTSLPVTGIYVLLILSVVMAIVSGYITHYNTLEKANATEILIRRYKSIQSTVQLLTYLKDVETGQHGYLVTKDSSFIESYNQAKAKVVTETDTLEKLISDNEPEMNLLKGKIIAAMNNKLKDLELGINILNAHGRDSASRRLSTRIGKMHMDTVRFLVQDLIQRERFLLSEQNKKLQAKTKLEDNVRFFAFSFIGLISFVAIVTLWQKQRDIKNLIESLRKANEELELKVQERTRQLVEAQKAKDHFLGIASHDLKVPIAGVLRLITLLQSDNGNRPVKEMEYLKLIGDSCNNMERLISNLLDINRIESGETILVMQEVDLKKLLSMLETNFSYQAEQKNIELVVEKTEGKIQTDPDVLYRIMENLLSNAIKFSKGGKSVRVRASNFKGGARFDFIDHGPGVRPEEIPNLFGKFQKLSNKPTGGEGSTGLGLSIVKELTNLLGAEITVTSVVGDGTTFTLIIKNE